MEEAVDLILKRHFGIGVEVVGSLLIKVRTVEGCTHWEKVPTLENRNLLFNDGVYRIVFEKSKRWKRPLWEFKDIPGRSEIKFHPGTNWQHSKGCVLLGNRGMDSLHRHLNPHKSYLVKVETIKSYQMSN